MPMPISGLVGQPGAPGSQNQPRIGQLAEGVVTELNGKYYESVRVGNVFTATTVGTGVALVSYGSTASGFVLYNPVTSQKKAQLIRMTLGYVSGTQTAGSICYATNILSTGTAPTGTAAAILSNSIGSGLTSAMTPFYTATVTALQLFETTGINTFAATASAIIDPWTARDDIDGRIVVNPGTTFSVAGSVAAFGTYIVSLSWIELPILA